MNGQENFYQRMLSYFSHYTNIDELPIQKPKECGFMESLEAIKDVSHVEEGYC
jgi:hypothetical protein